MRVQDIILQCVAVHCGVLQYATVIGSVRVDGNAKQCVAVCSSVLQDDI